MPSSSALVAASPSSSPGAQRPLERAALLGQVAAAVGRDPVRPATGSTSASSAGGGQRDLPRRRAATGRRPACGRPRRPGRPAGRRSRRRRRGARARRSRRRASVNGGSHSASATSPARRARRRSTARDVGRPVSRRGGDLGLGDGGRGEHERRRRRRSGAQTRRSRRSTCGDVGAEDAAVVVALVDHDVAQRAAGTRAQRACPGSSERCSMSGLVRTYSRVVARPSRARSRGVSPSYVAGRRPSAAPSAVERARAGRGPAPWWARGRARSPRAARAAPRAVDGSRSAPAAGRPATCPRPCRWRRTTCSPGVRGLGGLDLVRPRRADAAARRARRRTSGVDPVRPVGGRAARAGSTSRCAGVARARAPRQPVDEVGHRHGRASEGRPPDRVPKRRRRLARRVTRRHVCAHGPCPWFDGWPDSGLASRPVRSPPIARLREYTRGPDTRRATAATRPSLRSAARSTSTPPPSCATRSPSWSRPATTTSSSTWRTSSSSTRPASACWSAA